jgi:4-hydroxybenzoate polyprenyltransferase
MTPRDVLAALRPKQWTKNGFVLVGTLFGHRWSQPELLAALLAFGAFCFASSAVYVYNDWIDRAQDRRHPTKRARPIAAGRIGGGAAATLGLACAAVAYVLAGTLGPTMMFLVSAYFGLNVAYALWLKHIVIADVFAIAGGFQIRLFAGTLGLGIPPSQWLLLCGFALTLLLALGKRRGELVGEGQAEETRRVLGDYTESMLDQLLAVCATLVLAAYGLYTISPDTVAQHGAVDLPYTIPIVTYGVFRYLFVLRNPKQVSDGDPSRLLFVDRPLQLTALAWLGAVLWIMR